MKNVIFVEWDSFGNEDICQVFAQRKFNVIRVELNKKKINQEQINLSLSDVCSIGGIVFIFSFNYIPEISIFCNEREYKYVSWVYDSPHIHVYSYTVPNECNYIFLFDYAVYEEIHNAGINTVFYLPLAVNDKRLATMERKKEQFGKYTSDISFVGSLYSEKKHRLYDRFKDIPPFARGYLDGIIQIQKNIYGSYLLQDMLNESILEEMEKAYPTDPNALTVLSPRAIYADYVLARQVTSLERREILEMLGAKYNVDLYTYENNVGIPGVVNNGIVDYYDEMPYVFMNSKINLNITLKSIKTGIPLRAMDIMGAGGFLLSNYQIEYSEYFDVGKDLVIYSDYDDLMNKAEYYLTHEKEREEIALNGMRKVRENHTYDKRVDDILEIVCGSN